MTCFAIIYTFDLCDKAYARVLVSKLKTSGLDLADVYGHPWNDYKVVGFHCFYVSRNDRRELTRRELTRISKEVTYDLRFDYSESEVEFQFDDQTMEGVLRVDVQDAEGDP